MTTTEKLIDYFKYRRRDEIRKYKTARFPVRRADARSWVLHYGRLVRKLEAEG
jgi:hypothetical protein